MIFTFISLAYCTAVTVTVADPDVGGDAAPSGVQKQPLVGSSRGEVPKS